MVVSLVILAFVVGVVVGEIIMAIIADKYIRVE